jgi:hypothetical protein
MAELLPAGVEAALAAFRTALHSLRTRQDIESVSSEQSQSWSFITSLTESQALKCIEELNKKTVSGPAFVQSSQANRIQQPFSQSQKPYVSAVSPPRSVTISGPPQSLSRLIDSGAMKAHSIPIQSPYHAAHLYGPDDVDEVLGSLRNPVLEDYHQNIPILSMAKDTNVLADDFPGLLRCAVADTLCEQVRWDTLCATLKSNLTQCPSLKSCVVFPITSNAAGLLSSTLQEGCAFSVTVNNSLNSKVERSHTSHAPGRFQDSKVAIVGFSGRFPEAASNDELWEVLKAARDCHRTIPEDRFDWEAHLDPAGKKKNHSRVKFGCFINEPGIFDSRFFHLSPREAENTDPAQRLLLMSAYEAMERRLHGCDK